MTGLSSMSVELGAKRLQPMLVGLALEAKLPTTFGDPPVRSSRDNQALEAFAPQESKSRGALLQRRYTEQAKGAVRLGPKR